MFMKVGLQPVVWLPSSILAQADALYQDHCRISRRYRNFHTAASQLITIPFVTALRVLQPDAGQAIMDIPFALGKINTQSDVFIMAISVHE